MWLKAAAHSGATKAQLNLGLLYLAGRTLPQNNALGMHWIEKAAQGGDNKAQTALARAYAEGLYGVQKDADQARYWAQKAGIAFD